MIIHHPDITLYGTDETARRRRMVRDLELFLSAALGHNSHPNPFPDYREREDEPLYFPAVMPEDPRC